MENSMRSIVNDRDLDYYEKQLNKISYDKFPEDLTSKSIFGHYMTSCKGKLVKVEICGGGCMQIKVGMLLDVGADYIVIKVGNSCVSTAIPTVNIHSITFVHNNDRKQIAKY